VQSLAVLDANLGHALKEGLSLLAAISSHFLDQRTESLQLHLYLRFILQPVYGTRKQLFDRKQELRGVGGGKEALIMNESPEDTELDVGRLPQKTLINCSTTGSTTPNDGHAISSVFGPVVEQKNRSCGEEEHRFNARERLFLV